MYFFFNLTSVHDNYPYMVQIKNTIDYFCIHYARNFKIAVSLFIRILLTCQFKRLMFIKFAVSILMKKGRN